MLAIWQAFVLYLVFEFWMKTHSPDATELTVGAKTARYSESACLSLQPAFGGTWS